MVGEQHQVAVDQVDLLRVGILAFERPEKVGGVAEVVARFDRVLALAAAEYGADDGRKDGGERDRLFKVRFGQRRACALRRDDRAEDVHRVGGGLHGHERFAR